MKALFLTPIEENKKQQFLDTGIECIFKEKKSVTKEDFKDRCDRHDHMGAGRE